MNKLKAFWLFTFTVMSVALIVFAAPGTQQVRLTLGHTTVTGNSTNTTVGAGTNIFYIEGSFTVYASAFSTSGNNGDFKVHIDTSYDGSRWDNGVKTGAEIIIPMSGVTTNTGSTHFVVPGGGWIRQGISHNTNSQTCTVYEIVVSAPQVNTRAK